MTDPKLKWLLANTTLNFLKAVIARHEVSQHKSADLALNLHKLHLYATEVLVIREMLKTPREPKVTIAHYVGDMNVRVLDFEVAKNDLLLGMAQMPFNQFSDFSRNAASVMEIEARKAAWVDIQRKGYFVLTHNGPLPNLANEIAELSMRHGHLELDVLKFL